MTCCFLRHFCVRREAPVSARSASPCFSHLPIEWPDCVSVGRLRHAHPELPLEANTRATAKMPRMMPETRPITGPVSAIMRRGLSGNGIDRIMAASRA